MVMILPYMSIVFSIFHLIPIFVEFAITEPTAVLNRIAIRHQQIKEKQEG